MSKKIAVVSGASKGIGYAIAHKLAESGFDLIITARTAQDLEKCKTELVAKYSIDCQWFAADLGQKNEVEAFGNFVKKHAEHVDILVNNTGVFIQGNLMDEPDGQLEKQLNTNVLSAYYLSRQLIALLKKNPGSHVFNICSIASLQAYAYSGSYTISKFALLGFSKALRQELMPNVRVSSIMPGATYTSSWEGVDLPESRFIKASDIADMVWAAYQLSPSAVVEDIVIRPLEGDI